MHASRTALGAWLAMSWILVPPCAHAAGPAPITTNVDPAFGGFGDVSIVASLPSLDPSGIAVTEGRIFLTFPRHAVDHAGPVLAELRDGKPVAFPSVAYAQATDAPPSQRLVSPHGMTTDSLGRIWVIDDGKVKGHPIPPGGAKVVGIDPRTGQIIASVVLDAALRPDSHMNDLRVDLTHGAKGTAFVADSSFGHDPALVVVDLATGRQRRILAGHHSIVADPHFMTVLDGRPRVKLDGRKPDYPSGGVDSITLSPDSKTLYYSPLAGRELYSLPTALAADFDATDAQLAEAVRDEGPKGTADGLATDPWGRIYTTAGDLDAVMRRNTDGSFDIVARDARFVWPDGIFADAHFVYVVLGQWSRLPGFNGGHDLRKPPYLVARIPITAPSSAHD